MHINRYDANFASPKFTLCLMAFTEKTEIQ